MAVQEAAQPSGSSLLSPPDLEVAEINVIEKRLSDLEARLGTDGLGWESEYRKKLLIEVDQRIALRQVAFLVAGVVMAGMAAFAFCAFSVVADILQAGKQEGSSAGAIKIGLFVTPIISITAITLMLLIGAFKKVKDDDEKVNLPNLAAEAFKAFKG